MLWRCSIVDRLPPLICLRQNTSYLHCYAALPRSYKPTTRPFYGHASTVESGFQDDDLDEDDDLEYEEEEYIEIVDEADFEFGK